MAEWRARHAEENRERQKERMRVVRARRRAGFSG